MSTTAKDFLKNASRLFAIAPIRSARIILDENDPEVALQELRSLLQSPHIARLRTLDLSGNRIGESGARILASSKTLRHLHSLNLADNKLYNDGLLALATIDCPELKELNVSDNALNRNRDDVFTPERYDGLQVLSASGLLRNLSVLDVSRNRLHGEGLAALLSGPATPQLTDLNLARTGLKGEDVGILSASDHLHTLQTLNLSGNSVGLSGARALAQSPHLSGLRTLRLDWAKVGDEGVKALTSGTLRNLANLSLVSSRIGERGAEALAASPNMASLRRLDLGNGRYTDDCYHEYNRIFSEGARALAQSPQLRHLIYLNLAGNHIDKEGVRALATGQLTELRELNLSCNGLWDEGVIALANSKMLGNLRVLNLASNSIREKHGGMAALVRSPFLRHLTSLDLSINSIGGDGARCLAESENIRHIITLNLSGAGIGRDGVQALAASKMLANLSTLRLDSNIIEGGTQALVDSAAFPNLTILSLKKCSLLDEDVKLLAHSTSLPRVATLELDDNDIRCSDTLLALVRSNHFPNLTKLGMERTVRDPTVHHQIDELFEQRRTAQARPGTSSGSLNRSVR